MQRKRSTRISLQAFSSDLGSSADHSRSSQNSTFGRPSSARTWAKRAEPAPICTTSQPGSGFFLRNAGISAA